MKKRGIYNNYIGFLDWIFLGSSNSREIATGDRMIESSPT